ncbi:MAG: TAXI family TRAP transporter solute-binding subunit [Magnetococcales bacterium]|nr:TAXI family TRAP transporter solute-binding subunit [Magnetococcales bacterium]
MKRLAYLMIPILLLSGCSQEPSDKKQFVTIGTGGVTGVYYPAGGALCRMVNKTTDSHKIRCTVESTGGSVYNTNTLAAGELELGIAQADVAAKAVQGSAPFNHALSEVRSVLALHPEMVTLVARRDANIHSVADLKGKRINIGSPGSGNRRTATELLQSCGVEESDLALAGALKSSEMPDALRDNKLDGYFYVVGHPTANIKDAATGTPVNIVPLTEPCAAKVIAAHDYFVSTEVPAGLYRDITEAVPTYGVKATLITTTAVSEETIYQVVKAIFENLDDFRTLHPAFKTLNAESMRQGTTAPFHAGAIRYFKEKGWITE